MDPNKPAADSHENEPSEAETRGKEVQEELDDIPPPGTDPLHEGP